MATALFAQPIMPPGGQWTDNNGDPLNAGKVYVYQSGTTTNDSSYPTYNDALAGTNANANPVVLDSNGRAQIWLQAGRAYKIVVKDSTDATTFQTVDNYNAAGGYPFPGFDEWVRETNAVAFSSTVLFTVTGVDVTSRYHDGRRVKIVNSGGTVYGIVTDSSFASNTTVRVATQDGSVLDSGLSAVYYSLTSSQYQSASPSSVGERVSFVKAYRSASAGVQAITTGGARKIEFDTKSIDPLSEWDGVTNYRYTPTGQSAAAITGRGWIMHAQVTLATSITSAVIAIRRNGTTNIATHTVNHGITAGSVQVTAMEEDQGSTGNYYEVTVTPSGNVDVSTGADKTFFHIRRFG